MSADQIDEALVEQFLDSHLPRCDCHATALRTHGDLRANLAHLLASLREQHVILELPGPSGPIAEELCRYNAHMRDARGLAIGTREGRLAMVGRLLLCKFAGRPIAIGELQPDDVRGFIGAFAPPMPGCAGTQNRPGHCRWSIRDAAAPRLSS